MATAMFDPIFEQDAFELDHPEVDISAYFMPQESAIPGAADLPAEGPSRTRQAASGRSGATERAHIAAVMDTDVRA